MTVDGVMIRSLADVRAGEQIQVVAGLFDVVRLLCPAAILSDGETLLCEGLSARHILLRRADGRELSIDRFHASFIEVQSVGVAGMRSGEPPMS